MYQSLANVNVSNFVSLKLSGNKKSNNYFSWKRQMLGLIKGHDLIGFIDGSVAVLPETPPVDGGSGWNQRDYDVWRTDKVLRGWILGSISEPRLLEIVPDSATAREAWLALERRFDEKDSAATSDVERDYFKRLIPLLEAALSGDWAAAQQILESDPGAASIWIENANMPTPLEAAVGTRNTIDFVRNLLARLPDDERVALKNDKGSTSLHIASAVGNKEAATLLVDRMPSLCYEPDDNGDFPIHYAARYAEKDTLQYMITVTKDDGNPNPYQGVPGIRLLTYAIEAGFFGIVKYLVEKYPDLAMVKYADNDPALVQIVSRCEPSKNNQALQLEIVKLICEKLKSSDNFREARSIYENAMLKAAELDVQDVVEIIMDVFPLSIYDFRNPFVQHIFQVVIENRSIDVLNIVYQKIGNRHICFHTRDSDGNNLLHLAGKLAPIHKLNRISGAGFQMQHELRWFEEVKSIVHRYAGEEKNFVGKTPRQMFTEEHKGLREAGEKWMKDTANACIITAALIATVTFAAAITFPGAYHEDMCYSTFSRNMLFYWFLFGDLISLALSIPTLLNFLRILVCRYDEEDFLTALPRNLLTGLGFLVVSVGFMMICVSAKLALSICLTDSKILFLGVALMELLIVGACMPLAWDLLILMVNRKAYFPKIFGRKRNGPFPLDIFCGSIRQ